MSVLFRLHGKCAVPPQDTRQLVGVLLAFIWMCSPPLSVAQAAPGLHLQTGPTFVGGIGWQVGIVRASRMFAREAHLVADLEPLVRRSSEQSRVAMLVGASVRLGGIERTIGNVPYRGFDVDLSLRAGPALSFSSRDNAIARNSRFSLLVEPALRLTRTRAAGSTWYLEFGTVRPSVRIGRWFGVSP